MTTREKSIAIPLFVLAIWFGVYPQVVLNYMDNTIDQQVQQLADWTRDVKEPALARQADESQPTPRTAARGPEAPHRRPPTVLVATTNPADNQERTAVPREGPPGAGRADVTQRGR
jgi:hypothetical protein